MSSKKNMFFILSNIINNKQLKTLIKFTYRKKERKTIKYYKNLKKNPKKKKPFLFIHKT